MRTDLYKKVVGKFPTGVCVITTNVNDQLFGFTANSFTSVSLNPMIVSFCLKGDAASFSRFAEAEFFAVNILAHDQSDISRHFAISLPNKFEKIEYYKGQFGCPLIQNSLSFVECKKIEQIASGDHYIFLGEVQNMQISRDENPLIYYAKKYQKLEI